MGIEALPHRNHLEVMTSLVKLAGALALDIGCGEGRITRLMAGGGAKVTGVDPGPQQLERAHAQPAVGSEHYALGSAEALNFVDGSVDLVVFFNSLHHVPLEVMDRALAEASRVLRPGGTLYIAEPIAEGPQHELAKPFNDETDIRRCAYEAIGRAAAGGLRAEAEIRYVADGKHASFEAYRENSVAIEPGRARLFAQKESEIRALFEQLGEKRADGWHFPQPVRVNLLRK